MRTLSAVPLALAVCLGAAPAGFAAPSVVLSDPNLALYEIRPLDRHVYVLSLEGDWKIKPQFDAEYSVNIEYPDGAVIEHRPTMDRMFRRGEVQVLLVQYQYEAHHFQRGDKLTVFITKRKPGGGPVDQEVISNRLEVAWPFDRDVVRIPPRTRFSEAEPLDFFRPSANEPEPLPPPLPPPEQPKLILPPVPPLPPADAPVKPTPPAPSVLPPEEPVKPPVPTPPPPVPPLPPTEAPPKPPAPAVPPSEAPKPTPPLPPAEAPPKPTPPSDK